tara:strand:- start:1119 stop:1559 length:441 start_codon:yes stop_codon:yes gene_type:complete
MSFTLDIKKFADKTERNVNDVAQAVAIDLFSRVVKSTPVGNPSLWKKKPPVGYVAGRLRGNWQCSLGSPVMGALDTRDTSGGTTISNIVAVTESFKGDGAIFLTNNVPYANRIEYLGHSSQAPTGMVRINVLAFQQAINKAVQEIK